MRARYRTDPDRIVHETIDGESIVIDLETGVYFSLTGSAPEIWRLLVEGCSPAAVADAFASGRGDAPAVLDAVHRLVEQLCEAQLLFPDPTPREEPRPDPQGTWEPPVFETYTDMEYFLLLDPVHDVQAAGWPHAKPDMLVNGAGDSSG